jgi:hypothetical protein
LQVEGLAAAVPPVRLAQVWQVETQQISMEQAAVVVLTLDRLLLEGMRVVIRLALMVVLARLAPQAEQEARRRRQAVPGLMVAGAVVVGQ